MTLFKSVQCCNAVNENSKVKNNNKKHFKIPLLRFKGNKTNDILIYK